MKILATRTNSRQDDPDTHTYEVVKGGGILKKGGNITVTYGSMNDWTRHPPSAPSVQFKSTHTNLRVGVALGNSCSSTLPIFSEGIGIPKICEVQLPGRTKFKGHFDNASLVLESKGITNPLVKTRNAAMQKFLEGIGNSTGSNITSINCEPKKYHGAQVALDLTSCSTETRTAL